jgi:hypothetical protein
MSADSTRRVMERYFDAMGQDQDFSRFFSADVTWTTVDTAEQVSGPAAVRQYILDLHAQMSSGEQRELDVSDAHAYLEGSDVNGDPGLVYCLVYDVQDDQITAIRCYGTLATLTALPAS